MKSFLLFASLVSFCGPVNADCCQQKCETKIVYKDTCKIAPCAVEKKIKVEIFNSCTCKCECVEVTICVPNCDCFETKCKKNETKYDYGKYEIEVSIKNNVITVDYDN